ncbi:hypothetical protein GBAR_LOCUS602, partial [Geodia barretti]
MGEKKGGSSPSFRRIWKWRRRRLQNLGFRQSIPTPRSTDEENALSFTDIVDEDERTTEGRVQRVFVGWFVDSLAFRLAMLLVILLNCLVIGIQTDRYLEDNYGAVFVALDKLFLTVFVLE